MRWIAGILLLCPSVCAAAPPGAREVARVVDAYTRSLVARGDLSGQLLVLRHGQVLLERSFGMANQELGTPVTPETRFNIASVTKPMTVTLAIQLIQEKKLGVNDAISLWFPDFPKGDSITVMHLLGHRSGIPHEIMPDSAMTRPFTAAEIVDRARRLPLDFSPGSRESYSSGGLEVLARILELVSGRSYTQLLQKRVLGPLAMTHSANPDSRMVLPGRAAAYVPGPTGLENAPFQDFSGLVGAGSVWSTARDIHKFVEAVVTGKFGEGVRQSFVRGGRLDFNGRTGGFKAWAMWDSAGSVEAIFLGNVASGAPDVLKRDVLQLVSGAPVAATTFPVLRTDPLPMTDLQLWEGEYQIEHGPHLSLRVRDGALYANDWILQAAADGSMFSPRDYGTVRGVKDAGGRIVRLDWMQGKDTYPAPRVTGADLGR